jgi:hypothetical protein
MERFSGATVEQPPYHGNDERFKRNVAKAQRRKKDENMRI